MLFGASILSYVLRLARAAAPTAQASRGLRIISALRAVGTKGIKLTD